MAPCFHFLVLVVLRLFRGSSRLLLPSPGSWLSVRLLSEAPRASRLHCLSETNLSCSSRGLALLLGMGNGARGSRVLTHVPWKVPVTPTVP